MSEFAMLARADDGGLGALTWEVARHVRPERILLVDVQPARGTFRPERYDGLADEIRVRRYPLRASDLDWVLEAGRLFTAETFYLQRDGVPTDGAVLYAMPELFPPELRHLAELGRLDVLAPTEWEQDRLGRSALLPMPVATDRIVPSTPRDRLSTMLHISAPAMLDRNGTDLVRAACSRYEGPPLELLVAGPGRPDSVAVLGRSVTVRPVEDVRDYWERYTPDIDLLFQPRRYGGLSLVVAEAAAAGIPTLCLDREPESTWLGTIPVLAEVTSRAHMKGGQVEVWTTSPDRLADVLAELATAPMPVLAAFSGVARAWAEDRSWGQLGSAWHEALRQSAPEPV